MQEHDRWEAFRVDRLTRRGPLTTLTLDEYTTELTTLRALPGTPLALLDELEAWGQQLL